MHASEARILANQRNAQLSTGPKTVEGKERSRANALKHGLTGAGVVLPEADAAEVDRRAAAFEAELKPAGEVGKALVRRAALNSVRMERGADLQTAELVERVHRAEAEFVAPEGSTVEEAALLRSQATRRAMMTPSKEAALTRRHEDAAERGFLRCLGELRQLERTAKAAARADANAQAQAMMGSFLRMQEAGRKLDERLDAMEAGLDRPPVLQPARSTYPAPIRGGVDVPITIGRRP